MMSSLQTTIDMARVARSGGLRGLRVLIRSTYARRDPEGGRRRRGEEEGREEQGRSTYIRIEGSFSSQSDSHDLFTPRPGLYIRNHRFTVAVVVTRREVLPACSLACSPASWLGWKDGKGVIQSGNYITYLSRAIREVRISISGLLFPKASLFGLRK